MTTRRGCFSNRRTPHANIVVIDPYAIQGLSHGYDHARGPCDVEDRRGQVVDGALHDLSCDQALLARPGKMGGVHLRHRCHRPEVRVLTFELLQLGKKCSVIRSAVGIQQDQALLPLVLRRLPQYAHERRDADTTGDEYSRTRRVLVQSC